MIKVSASILSADISNLEKEIRSLADSRVDMIHIDVMDGCFVHNLTFGPPVIQSIRKHTNLPFDVHLMIDSPEKHIEDYINSGADIITIHPETTVNLHQTLSIIKKSGAKSGIALFTPESADLLKYKSNTDIIDHVLVMSVKPGLGGQEFITDQLVTIKIVAGIIKDKDITLAVDGGINDMTAKPCVDLGANILVSGSFIFNKNRKQRINYLQNL